MEINKRSINKKAINEGDTPAALPEPPARVSGHGSNSSRHARSSNRSRYTRQDSTGRGASSNMIDDGS